MLNRWKKIDIFIAILLLITIISFFSAASGIFGLLLWSLIIIVLIRLLFLVKRRLFWKIRNRLIFSGLFLVATPIIFISMFSYFIGTVVIAQYGSMIVDNLMNEQLNKMSSIPKPYLLYENPKYIRMDLNRWASSKMLFFTIIFWEKEGETFKPFYKFEVDFDIKKIPVEEFRGYFMVGNKLYLGVLEKNETLAALVAHEINQEFLDKFSSISDFRVIYKKPRHLSAPTSTDGGLTADSANILNNDLPPPDSDNFIPMTAFTFTYSDFDSPLIAKRKDDFVLSIDYGKIYNKIVKTMSNPAQGPTKRFIYALIVPFITLMIVSFFIGFRMVRVITRSINQLTKGTQRIRNGDFSFRIKTRSGDQMQYLGESFNEMASGIDRLLIDEKEKQRLEEELRIARSIQLKLLPPDIYQTEEFEIAAVNIPAEEIAGDYFDYFYKKNESLSLLVADVSGKGASAAFYMAELKGVINHLIRENLTLPQMVAECHHSLKQSFDKVTFITMNIAHMNIPEKTFSLVRAGHTQALFYQEHKKECIELFPEGMAIGLVNFKESKNKEINLTYDQGDILFLFSDGLSEIMNEDDEMLGIDHLKRILCTNHMHSAEEIKQKMLDFSIKFSETGINRDDLTFIVLKVR